MRKWCMLHSIGFMALYALFYLGCFGLLEKAIVVPDLWVHCHLDDLIPFCKYAIIPYVMWFPWIPFTLFYILRRAPRADFWRLCLPLFAGMTLSLLFYVVVPNGLALRPHSVPGTDFFCRGSARIVSPRYPHQRLPVHPCVQLGDPDVGLLPLQLL